MNCLSGDGDSLTVVDLHPEKPSTGRQFFSERPSSYESVVGEVWPDDDLQRAFPGRVDGLSLSANYRMNLDQHVPSGEKEIIRIAAMYSTDHLKENPSDQKKLISNHDPGHEKGPLILSVNGTSIRQAVGVNSSDSRYSNLTIGELRAAVYGNDNYDWNSLSGSPHDGGSREVALPLPDQKLAALMGCRKQLSNAIQSINEAEKSPECHTFVLSTNKEDVGKLGLNQYNLIVAARG